MPAANPARHVVDHLLQVVAHGQLVDAWPLHVAADAKESGSTVARRPNRGVGGAAHFDHVRHAGDGFRVIDGRGAAVEADDRRERGPDARNPSFALQRLHQRRLFAHLIGPRSSMCNHLELGIGAEDVLAQKAFGVGIGNGLLHNVQKIAILAAQVDKANFGADGQAGNDRTFNHCMRIVQKDQVILAGSGLALIAVDQDIFWLFRLLGDERPLHARRKSSPSAAPQAAGLHLVDNPGRSLLQALFRGRIAPQFEIAFDLCRSLAKAPGHDLYFIGMGDQPRHERPSLRL